MYLRHKPSYNTTYLERQRQFTAYNTNHRRVILRLQA